ncbi:hypothetical protein [Limibacillus sp. MBR-115]|uniref:hypothetical protein n=1 Tax=Limibacillus sp. MBR-115 TaxID=3156465 RepID=UPI00339AFBFC
MRGCPVRSPITAPMFASSRASALGFVDEQALSFNGVFDYMVLPIEASDLLRSDRAFSIGLYMAWHWQNDSVVLLSTMPTAEEDPTRHGFVLSVNLASGPEFGRFHCRFEGDVPAGQRARALGSSVFGWTARPAVTFLLTYDGSGSAAGFQLYVNGVPDNMSVVEDTLTGPVISYKRPNVAGNPGSGAIFRPTMDASQLILCDRALTQIEAIEHHNGIAGDPRNSQFGAAVRHWWPIGEGDVLPWLDDRISGLQAEAIGFTASGFVAKE